MKEIIPFVVSLLISFTNAETECTKENVKTCVANMEQFELDEYDAIVPRWTEAELTEMCTEYKMTDACIDDLIQQCSAYDQYYYRAVENSWDYICEDKNKEYLDIRKCLDRQDLHDQANTHCTKTWEKRVTDLDQDKFRHATGQLNKDGLSSLCNAATEYLNCVYTEVELKCGKEAAAWQRGFDDTLIQPILQLVGCQAQTGDKGTIYVYPTEEGLSQTVIIIIAISIALGVLVMVIIAILLLRQNKKSRMREPPPGEPGPYVIYDPTDGAIAGPMVGPPVPPSYKGKGDLGPEYGPEFGIPMPPPPASGYGPPPSYKPAESVASGRTSRSHRSGRSHHYTVIN